MRQLFKQLPEPLSDYLIETVLIPNPAGWPPATAGVGTAETLRGVLLETLRVMFGVL